MLRHFFLHSNLKAPVVKQHVYDLFMNMNDGGEVPTNTFVQTVSRLRRQIAQCDLPSTLISTCTYQKQTAYYYENNIPFMIINEVMTVLF
ncbi:hypothetical protein [Sutcliffiella sp. NC1]|uniref:hypothetical protein n=1 Tax=Sutcliffiella sp. NC1 TaxID=3004096 RepID=UPI0022DE0A5C|nr:hypothetical protein [Sutcliffiella sp. NC1]WBL16881.1 hypothetical protein O1A01_09700 [Sutcliffiella sp. NC1]